MIKSRNLTSHTYNEEVTREIVTATIHSYFDEFSAFQTRMKKIKEEQQ